MTGASRAIGVVLLGTVVLAGGCVRRPPRTAPPPPAPLEVPVVPPRVLAPVAVEPDEPPAAEEPTTAAPPRPARPRPRVETSPRPEQPATHDPSKIEGPPEPPPDQRPPEPKTVLQTPQTAGDADAERRVREVLGRARRELGQVNPAALGSDARTQFETARRFIDQAEDALKARNYMFARYLADKAEALARGLTGR